METKFYRNATAKDTVNAVNNLITSNFNNGSPVCVMDIAVDGEDKKETIIGFLVVDGKEEVKSVIAHTRGISDNSPFLALFEQTLAENLELAGRNGLVYRQSDVEIERLLKDAFRGDYSKYWEDYGTLMTGLMVA